MALGQPGPADPALSRLCVAGTVASGAPPERALPAGRPAEPGSARPGSADGAAWPGAARASARGHWPAGRPVGITVEAALHCPRASWPADRSLSSRPADRSSRRLTAAPAEKISRNELVVDLHRSCVLLDRWTMRSGRIGGATPSRAGRGIRGGPAGSQSAGRRANVLAVTGISGCTAGSLGAGRRGISRRIRQGRKWWATRQSAGHEDRPRCPLRRARPRAPRPSDYRLRPGAGATSWPLPPGR